MERLVLTKIEDVGVISAVRLILRGQ